MELNDGRPYSTHVKNHEYCGVNPGDQFGDLTVVSLGRIEKFDSGSSCGVVKCVCPQGHEIDVISFYLTNGWVKKCYMCSQDDAMSDKWLYLIARDIYNECFDDNKKLKPGKVCDLGTSIQEIKETIKEIPGWKYRETGLWFVDREKGYTIHHPRHKTQTWVCLDLRNGQHYKCRGNLRWIPKDEIKQRVIELPMSQLETIPRSNQTFLRICNTRHWNPNEFGRVWKPKNVGGIKRKGWLFYPLSEFSSKYREPLKDVTSEVGDK